MKVLLTGATGMLGRAVLKASGKRPDIEFLAPRRNELDLLDRARLDSFLDAHQPEAIVHMAARVGGIQANVAAPADFYVDNVIMNTNVIDGAHRSGVERLINIGSSCMYPKDYASALKESDLLAGPLEPTNEGYALSKITATRHCAYLSEQHHRLYRTLIPCNLYGPHDDFAPERSHLVAAVIKKVDDAVRTGASEVEIWGDGTARREFLFVDDLADFIVDRIGQEEKLPPMMNVGAGVDHTVNEYHQLTSDLLGFSGNFTHDLDRPVGMKRKLLDITLASRHGWTPKTSLEKGLTQTYRSYQQSIAV